LYAVGGASGGVLAEVGIAPSFAALVRAVPDAALLAIDVPIGLPDAGPRACDVEARAFLGRPRGSSVFPAPIRAVLPAATYAEACARHEAVDGRRLTLQAFHLLSRIREVDAFLRSDRLRADRTFEVHPEVAFAHLLGAPVVAPKRTAEGRGVRRAALERIFPGGFEHARQDLRGAGRYAADDLLDALVVLWSAGRLRAGTAATFPAAGGARDVMGLRMEIAA